MVLKDNVDKFNPLHFAICKSSVLKPPSQNQHYAPPLTRYPKTMGYAKPKKKIYNDIPQPHLLPRSTCAYVAFETLLESKRLKTE